MKMLRGIALGISVVGVLRPDTRVDVRPHSKLDVTLFIQEHRRALLAAQG